MSPKSGNSAFLKVIALLEALVILAMGVFLVWFVFIRDGGDNAAVTVSEQDPQVRTRAVIEKEETFYQLDGKKILMHDSSLGETFVPVYGDVPASDVDIANVVSRN